MKILIKKSLVIVYMKKYNNNPVGNNAILALEEHEFFKDSRRVRMHLRVKRRWAKDAVSRASERANERFS